MGWDEALDLVKILRADPSSMLAASMEGWSHPVSREALVLMDLFDLEHTVNSKKQPKPHPGRPWGADKRVERKGNVAGRSAEAVRAILTAARHGTAPV